MEQCADRRKRRSGMVRKKEIALVIGKRRKGMEVLNFLFFCSYRTGPIEDDVQEPARAAVVLHARAVHVRIVTEPSKL
jgi:hypothetical protein